MYDFAVFGTTVNYNKKTEPKSSLFIRKFKSTTLFSIILYQIVGVCQERNRIREFKGGINEKDKFQ